VTVQKGTEFGTQPDSNGDFLKFVVTQDSTPTAGSSEVVAPVEAAKVGEEYGVGSGTITYMPNPPTNVESVNNPITVGQMSGGENVETNLELRNRLQNAITQESGGGTTDGIVGYIVKNTDARSAIVNEYFSGDGDRSYPHAHVVVDGGGDAEVSEAIEDSRPVAVEHVLERPTTYTIDVTADVEGTSVDTAKVRDNIEEYVTRRGLGDDIIRNKLIQIIMSSDNDITNIQTLNVSIANEAHTFDNTTDVYALDKGSDMENDGITEVTGTVSGNSETFVEDTDYQEWNSSSGNTSTPHDSIDWSLSGDEPDDGTDFFVDYHIADDLAIDDQEKSVTGNITVSEV